MSHQEFYDGYLNGWKKHWEETGLLPVLFSAVGMCGEWKIPLPEWASLAVLNLIIDNFNTKSMPGAKGAHARLKSRMVKDYAHYLRWSAVRSCLFLAGLNELPEPAKPGRPSIKSKSDEPTRDFLLSEAMRILSKNKYAQSVTQDAVEESYIIVRDSRAASEHRFRFEDFQLIAPQNAT
ncbi:MAG: hypothetical protein E5Y10_24915 [Mesorhizobium sp.]|uniref:hypothetical protein n=1 Tax=Mesorhizobium sp. TaxID=1871066 RepID=UPI0012256E9C|nr:hypothetical protein [Mesorhizobium sp.]TIN38826.1 MAG: hypothetical protein E5Y13_15340 [Mesorhizobium sp.]TJU85664.1 MAG: hypothetical protein E5Y10_24915 [Mesorhizobium sp.]